LPPEIAGKVENNTARQIALSARPAAFCIT
jgi:hypothetical protein